MDLILRFYDKATAYEEFSRFLRVDNQLVELRACKKLVITLLVYRNPVVKSVTLLQRVVLRIFFIE